MPLPSTLQFCLLTGTFLLASVMTAVRLLPEARSSFLGVVGYGGFLFVCTIIVLQTTLGWLHLLTPLWTVAVGSTVGILGILGSYRSYAQHCPLPRIPHPILIVLLPLCGLLILELFNALIFPVWEYDSIAYHVPMARFWLTTGSLRQAYFSVFAGPVGYYPGTGELLTLWPMLLTGTDGLANIQNIILLPLGAAATLLWTRQNGIPDRSGILCPLLFLTSPVVLKELGTPHVDLFFAVTFVFSLLFLQAFVRTGTRRSWLLLCMSTGLFMGSKYLAAPLAVLFLMVASARLFVGATRTLRERTMCIMGGLILCTVTGGHWYIRNILLTGNPLFPASLTLGQTTFLHGYPMASASLLATSLLGHLHGMAGGAFLSLSMLFAWRMGFQILLMLLVYILVLSMFRRTRRPETLRCPRHFLWIVLLIPIVLLLYLAAPHTFIHFDSNIRYAILLLPLGGYVIASLTSTERTMGRILMIGSITIVIGTVARTLRLSDLPHEIATLRLIHEYPQTFGLFTIRSLFIILIAPALALIRRRRPLALTVLSLAIVLIPSVLFAGNSSMTTIRRERTFRSLHEKYPAFTALIDGAAWIAQNTSVSDGIGYSGFHFRYPFMNRLDQRVNYVPVNACMDCNYVDFRNEPEGIQAHASKQQWLKNLQSTRTNYLVLSDAIGALKYEPAWVEEEQRRFTPVFREDDVMIFKVEAMERMSERGGG